MHEIDDTILRKRGFEEMQIKQLSMLRRNYTKIESGLTLAECKHLEFIRWLVLTGKLADHKQPLYPLSDIFLSGPLD